MIEKNSAFFVLDYSVTGGVERVVSSLAYLFNKNGLAFNHLISLFSSNKEPEITFPPTLKITVLFQEDKGNISKKLCRILKENNITTLIFQGDNMTTSLQVLQAAKAAGCRAILHYHGSPYGYLRKYIYRDDIIKNPMAIFKLLWAGIVYPFKKIKLQKVIQQADAFVCVSYGAKEEINTIFNLAQPGNEKIITIHNPLSFKLTDALTDISAKENIIVYVSRLHRKHKNSMLVLRGWQRIAKDNAEWRLQVIGDGKLKKEMIQFVEENKLPAVSFTGIVTNVEDYLKRSSISVLTSDCEGLGMGLLESAVYKNAIVATKSDGGVTDIVEDGITGYLVKRNDDISFAAKLQQLISQKNVREQMAGKLFGKMNQFSDEKIMAQWKQLLSQQ
ncbi:MAG: glycosyltransferase [Ferruginibacter sp.]